MSIVMESPLITCKPAALIISSYVANCSRLYFVSLNLSSKKSQHIFSNIEANKKSHEALPEGQVGAIIVYFNLPLTSISKYSFCKYL